MTKLKVLSLFTGIGGADLGLERADMEIVAMCEIDKHCQTILKQHWPTVPIYSDIKLLDSTQLGQIDVIAGGFPCVDISFAGNRNGIHAERSGLWKEYWRLINEIRPKYVIIENVEYLRKNGLGVVLNDLARIGYDAEWSTITAESVGYPHQRKRLFIISYPSGQRQYEYLGERRPLQINKEREIATIYTEGKECQSEFVEICPILSRGTFNDFRNSYPNQGTSVSKLRRVTNGFSSRLDEKNRKQRIKQLGNAIVPRIMEIIGKAINKEK